MVFIVFPQIACRRSIACLHNRRFTALCQYRRFTALMREYETGSARLCWRIEQVAHGVAENQILLDLLRGRPESFGAPLLDVRCGALATSGE